MSSFKKVLATISSVIDINVENVQENTELTDIEGWDSMVHMMFISQFEKDIGVNLTTEQIVSIKRVEDAAKLVND